MFYLLMFMFRVTHQMDFVFWFAAVYLFAGSISWLQYYDFLFVIEVFVLHMHLVQTGAFVVYKCSSAIAKSFNIYFNNGYLLY